ncbi:hypothetical protein BD780_000161 [Clostridium tetanomorphum]|uniref:Uncharacterized protein n=1 Tax=Clostridium tetanomorphum TaxID=1553 RepID=A0A923J0D9_CLOTT|nr:hypothetical protein [Clostridium tetanomorphum]KAJ50301.1 hypothetical protein CTM_18700 [Clostridium tetanomorphum DSM 665]MBC2397962.1 hypothetical protein [Clostridium tetanomorphum]MBP1864532.1 hypothetical protein [Clostridium tetanomorphum]NRS82936.1 hypothetical protein [Clostridium tetanomorphum]NRZ98967.1 hypothetical protein [Clostridium tetanomorphum]
MNINNITGIKLQRTFIDFNSKHHNNIKSFDTKENNSKQVVISGEAIKKYEFSNRLKEAFKEAFNDKKEDGEFIKSISNEYMKIRKEIKGENYSQDQDININILNEALEDVKEWATDSITNRFDMFFNYSSNIMPFYNMKKDEEIFNKEQFRDNLSSLMDKAVNTLKNLPENIGENDLNKKINSILISESKDNSLEKMGLDDIKKLNSFLNELPRLSLSYDVDKIKDNIENYQKTAKEALDSSGLPEHIKKNAKKAVGKNVRAYGKVSAYRIERKSREDEVEKLMNFYASLLSQYNSLEKDIKKCRKENNLKMIKSLLKMQMNLQKQMDKLKVEIDKAGKSKDALTSNPDSVEGTETFKEISEAFDEEEV